MSNLTIDQALDLALRHHSAGELQQAEAIYRQILQHLPNHPDATHYLGVVAHQVGRNEAAVELIEKAIKLGADYCAAHNNLGEAFRNLGQYDRAVAEYRRAIQLDPNFAAAYSNLGVTLPYLDQIDEARSSFQKAIQLNPNFAEALSNYGNLIGADGRRDEAMELYRRAIAANPSYPPAHNNLAVEYDKVDQLGEAEAEYNRAIQLQPTFAEAITNLGSLKQKSGRFDEAFAIWKQAAQVAPNHANAQWNVALGTLARGDYIAGWNGYEYRYKAQKSSSKWRDYPKPVWDGSPLNGKTILLFPEQGFGDVLQFARFVPIVQQRGGQVILQVQPELVELMRTLDGSPTVIPDKTDPPAYDVYQALMSIPRVVGNTLADLPAKVPYLHADPARVARLQEKMIGATGRRKVGIVWGGNILPDAKRSCALALLAPLIELPDIDWFSLQKGAPVEELDRVPFRDRIVDLAPHLNEFADTAAALANLDRLVTIDTAVAHLAGAMGIDTWTMIPFAPDWRWMFDRTDSPWYPTMRLFRQSRMNDWSDVIAQITGRLRTPPV